MEGRGSAGDLSKRGEQHNNKVVVCIEPLCVLASTEIGLSTKFATEIGILKEVNRHGLSRPSVLRHDLCHV
jgi:hypothetical protein